MSIIQKTCIVIFGALFSLNIFAQKSAMSIIDFVNIPGLSVPEISPNGTELLYTLAESDWKENRQVSQIWRINVDGSDDRQITFDPAGAFTPRWSPDGKWISFLAKRNDDEGSQIYLMRNDGGEARRLTDHPIGISSIQWTSDGEHIYYLSTDTITKAKKKALDLNDDVFAYDENFEQRHLWKVQVSNGKRSKVTNGNYSVASFDVSIDGTKIAMMRTPDPLFDHYSDAEIWIMDIDGSNAIQLTDNQVGESGVRISPDNQHVLFTAFANESFDFYYNDKLFVLKTDGSGELSLPLGDVDYEVFGAEWSGDGQQIYYSANMGCELQLWQYSFPNKKSMPLTKGNHSIGSWTIHPSNNNLYFAVNTISNPGDLFTITNGNLNQITHHYDYLVDSFHLPKQESIRWKGADGVEVEGLIYYPHDYQSGVRYPLVVQTHGGPASSDRYGMSRSFSRYNPVLTGHGYVVLQPNYRGSTGYGDDFLRDMVGGYFRQSHLDVMAGVDHLISLGIADPDRMVKMGWSAGGHMTNKLITFTDRFKAASSGAGAVNWMGMYAQSDVRTYRTPWFGGSPWQKDAPTDVYWDNSPLKDIHKVTTPTLVIVGQNDVRVPLPQSVELYRALRSLDVPSHLYVAPREPHGWRELRHRLYKMNVELDWFAKYALGKDYAWEEAPE